jgi:putative spermidine/putrescine transport system substrate-binding protein
MRQTRTKTVLPKTYAMYDKSSDACGNHSAKSHPVLNMGTKPVNRRLVLSGAASSAMTGFSARAGSRQLVVANFGGAMAAAKEQAIYRPFTRETGIEIISVPGPSLAKIKLQVESGNVQWDVVDLLPMWLPTATRQGLLEPIDTGLVDRRGCIPQAFNHFAIGGSIYASGIGFATHREGVATIGDWAQFWDVKRIPGRRALLRRIPDTLEIALLADGVPARNVYPCDVDRAFRALDRIKPAISHWIAQTEQSTSLIQQDEVDFTHTYSTRVKNMQEAGANIGYSFRQNLLGVIWTGVVKNSSNRKAAFELCKYIADPQRQVALSNLSGDAPTYVDAVPLVSASTRKWLPNLSDPDNLFANPAWWDQRLESLTLRFQEWLFS